MSCPLQVDNGIVVEQSEVVCAQHRAQAECSISGFGNVAIFLFVHNSFMTVRLLSIWDVML
jgi:hypothetical protein